jgi:hypothetical protein
MSITRTIRRPLLVLGAAVAGVPALALLLAGPAEASCSRHGCSSHAWPSSSFRHGGHGPEGPSHVAAVPGSVNSKRFHPYSHLNPAPLPVSPNRNVPNFAPSPSIASGGPGSRNVQPVNFPQGGGGGMAFSPYGRGRYNTAGGGSGEANGTNGANSTNTDPNGTARTNTDRTNNGGLTAVLMCVTPQGNCKVDQYRVGSACECKSEQGQVYDGVVK